MANLAPFLRTPSSFQLPRLGGSAARALDRLKARVALVLTYGGRLVLFCLIVFGGGLGSAWYMTNQPTMLTAERTGPWVSWIHAGRPDADPYTRLRFARQRSLPLNASVVTSYEARTDSEGRRLQSSCEYVLEGPEPPARWWSLAVYDDRGRLIRNAADRYAFNSGNISRNLDGSVTVALARDARPGNWLPVGAGGRLTVVLTMQGLIDQVSIDGSQNRPMTLPAIRRLQCA